MSTEVHPVRSPAEAPVGPGAVVLDIRPLLGKFDEDDFYRFCRANPERRIERTSQGELIVMTPAGGESGNIEFRLAGLFWNWVETNGEGIGFSSSTGFLLPNGAERSPDLAWVARARWDALAPDEQERFPPLCPDFVVEIRSRSDSLATLKAKMQEYLDNGARLGWLIDPIDRVVWVYRPGTEVERLENPAEISGEPVLRGFTLELGRLWGPS
ncbi:MAG: Uma2 family endonuclease [Thermoguttaceae bacterium]|nr:Uma2 family endonuclease [Thermoguttaceae bacterium]